MNNRRYKVGDKVRIKHILEYESDKYVFGVNVDMECWGGKIMTIAAVVDCGDSPDEIMYLMKEDNHWWHWSNSMFESYLNEHFINLSNVI